MFYRDDYSATTTDDHYNDISLSHLMELPSIHKHLQSDDNLHVSDTNSLDSSASGDPTPDEPTSDDSSESLPARPSTFVRSI